MVICYCNSRKLIYMGIFKTTSKKQYQLTHWEALDLKNSTSEHIWS